MKLKTVKDLEPKRKFPNSGDSGYSEGFFEGVDKTKEEVKDLAIKWVKFRNIKIDTDFCEFHDITEEDLK